MRMRCILRSNRQKPNKAEAAHLLFLPHWVLLTYGMSSFVKNIGCFTLHLFRTDCLLIDLLFLSNPVIGENV